MNLKRKLLELIVDRLFAEIMLTLIDAGVDVSNEVRKAMRNDMLVALGELI